MTTVLVSLSKWEHSIEVICTFPPYLHPLHAFVPVCNCCVRTLSTANPSTYVLIILFFLAHLDASLVIILSVFIISFSFSTKLFPSAFRSATVTGSFLQPHTQPKLLPRSAVFKETALSQSSLCSKSHLPI